MAYDFESSGGDQRLSNTGTPSIFSDTGSVSFWINPESFGDQGFGRIYHFTDANGRNDGHQIHVYSSWNSRTNGLNWQFCTDSSAQQNYQCPGNTVSTGTWANWVFTYDRSGWNTPTAPTVWKDGSTVTLTYVAGSTNIGTPFSISAADEFRIGQSGFGDREFDGLIAHMAFWDVELTAADAAMLAAGVSPLLVKPQNLITYYPLDGLQEVMGGLTLTKTGSPALAASRPIYYPQSPIIRLAAAAAPAGTRPQNPLGHPLAGPFAGPIG